jgi:hypothetical protein
MCCGPNLYAGNEPSLTRRRIVRTGCSVVSAACARLKYVGSGFCVVVVISDALP